MPEQWCLSTSTSHDSSRKSSYNDSGSANLNFSVLLGSWLCRSEWVGKWVKEFEWKEYVFRNTMNCGCVYHFLESGYFNLAVKVWFQTNKPYIRESDGVVPVEVAYSWFDRWGELPALDSQVQSWLPSLSAMFVVKCNVSSISFLHCDHLKY